MSTTSGKLPSPHVALARDRFAARACTHLSEADAVAMSASTNAWVLYDQLEPLVGQVSVAHLPFRE
jgi:hypothetical protein